MKYGKITSSKCHLFSTHCWKWSVKLLIADWSIFFGMAVISCWIAAVISLGNDHGLCKLRNFQVTKQEKSHTKISGEWSGHTTSPWREMSILETSSLVLPANLLMCAQLTCLGGATVQLGLFTFCEVMEWGSFGHQSILVFQGFLWITTFLLAFVLLLELFL